MSSNKTLVAHESKSGATEESARKIADTLRSKFQLEVDLVDLRVQNISNCAQYQNIVVIGGVSAGKVYGMSILGKKIFDTVDLAKAEAWAEKLGKKFTQ